MKTKIKTGEKKLGGGGAGGGGGRGAGGGGGGETEGNRVGTCKVLVYLSLDI